MSWLKKIACIVLIVIACFYGFAALLPNLMELAFGASFMTAATALVSGNLMLAAFVALVGATIIDPDTTSETLNKVGEAVGKTASAVVDGAASAAGSLFTNSKLFLFGGLALAAYLLLGNDDNSRKAT